MCLHLPSVGIHEAFQPGQEAGDLLEDVALAAVMTGGRAGDAREEKHIMVQGEGRASLTEGTVGLGSWHRAEHLVGDLARVSLGTMGQRLIVQVVEGEGALQHRGVRALPPAGDDGGLPALHEHALSEITLGQAGRRHALLEGDFVTQLHHSQVVVLPFLVQRVVVYILHGEHLLPRLIVAGPLTWAQGADGFNGQRSHVTGLGQQAMRSFCP